MSQLFGMDNLVSTFGAKGNYENKVNKEGLKNAKNTIGKPELSEKASAYYEELKAKYGDVEFVLVDDEHVATAKEQAANVPTNKGMIVLISESEVEEMTNDESKRAQNEKLIADAKAQMPELLEQLKTSGADVKSFGMEFNDDGTANYFAVVDKSIAAQKERIENQIAEKRAEQKADMKADKKAEAKEDLVTVSASSMDELIKKIKDVMFEAKADTIRTEQEKMVGQSFDFTV